MAYGNTRPFSKVSRDAVIKTYRNMNPFSRVDRNVVVKTHRVYVHKKTSEVVDKELLHTQTYTQWLKDCPTTMEDVDLERLADPVGWHIKQEYGTITDWVSSSSTITEGSPSTCVSDESSKPDKEAVVVAKQPKKAPRPSAWNVKTSKELPNLFHGLDYTPK